jgi:hypothetical protein
MDTMSARIVWPRVILGFVIAPLIVPLAYFIFAAATGRNHGASELAGTLLTYGPYAYLFALLLGIPAFWLLRKSGHAGLWSFALAAGAIGLIGAGLLSAIGLKLEGVYIGTLAGVLAGAVFYLVAGLSR